MNDKNNFKAEKKESLLIKEQCKMKADSRLLVGNNVRQNNVG